MKKFKSSSPDIKSLDKVSETRPSVNRSIQTSTQEIHLICEEIRKAEESLALVIDNQKDERIEEQIRFDKNSLLWKFL
jgi:hypothetical protein